ncbi:MAG TPA: VOC family protein [Candidatus Acidoferrales bacterium]|nr:VOC family protein [Candidatus Acidoferrales bacterium]
MSAPITRRYFLALTGTLMSSPTIPAAGNVPPTLDHILLGAGDLDAGVLEVEKKAGVRAAGGGSHPGAGTRNALLSLGTERYLEIIAPDPQQSGTPSTRYGNLAGLKQPRLVGWAVHTHDIEGVARRLRDAGMDAVGPNDGSRVRPDGKTLHWRTLNLKDNRGGLLPFFIQWGDGTVHPSVDAPGGCSLVSFEVESADDSHLRELFQKMGIEVAVRRGAAVLLRARIAGLRGDFELTS